MENKGTEKKRKTNMMYGGKIFQEKSFHRRKGPPGFT